MVEPEVVRATVDAYLEAARALDVDRYASLFAPDAVHETPRGRLQGREAIRASAQQRWSRVASGELHVERLIVAGASAALSYSIRATMQDGRTGTVGGIDILEVNAAGQIQTARYYYDPAEFRALLA